MKRSISLSLLSLCVACSGEPNAPPAMVNPPPVQVDMMKQYEHAAVTEARVQYPRFIDVEKKVIARTCSPNPGVCHQTNNYPDLHTAGNVLALVWARCNVELPDPTQGWDGCEQRGDQVRLGEMVRELGFIKRTSAGQWTASLRQPSPATMNVPLELVTAENDPVFVAQPGWDVTVEVNEGSSDLVVRTAMDDPFVVEFVDSVLMTAVGGDPNQNGVYGADDPARAGAVIVPGSIEKSYLWGRVTGTVPGTRMPLANQALSNAEYVALACWIEGLDPDGAPSATDAIDYDACNFAKDPIEYATP